MSNLQQNMMRLAKISSFVLATLGTAKASEIDSAPVPANITHEVGCHSFGWILEEEYRKIIDTIAEGRQIYTRLSALVEDDYHAAEVSASLLSESVIGALALAEYIFFCLPEISVIKKMDRNSMAYRYIRAVGALRSEASALASLVRQITHISPEYKSEIDPQGLSALAQHGAKVSHQWS